MGGCCRVLLRRGSRRFPFFLGVRVVIVEGSLLILSGVIGRCFGDEDGLTDLVAFEEAAAVLLAAVADLLGDPNIEILVAGACVGISVKGSELDSLS